MIQQLEPPTKQRLPALDWMRGIVMMLMATDHASGAFNAKHLVTDSTFFYNPSVPLPAIPFFYRWVSHLCAPTFLFLAGTALALSIARKLERGTGAWRIDRDLLIRGLIILAVEVFFINWFWFPGVMLLQVMYAIGLSMIIMIPARRLPTAGLVTLALAILVGSEFFLPQFITDDGGMLRNTNRFLFGSGFVDGGAAVSFILPEAQVDDILPVVANNTVGNVLVAYPVVPWFAMMALGWAFGRYVVKTRRATDKSGSPGRLMLVAGLLALAVFIVVRGLNGFGNMNLPRVDGTLVQWLHVSKYPPSLTFTTLELGIMALTLAALFRYQRSGGGVVSSRNPVLVFGQTAFFFYIAHIFLLEVSARALGMHASSLGPKAQDRHIEATLATIVVLVVLYPLCLMFRKAKTTYPTSLLRFF